MRSPFICFPLVSVEKVLSEVYPSISPFYLSSDPCKISLRKTWMSMTVLRAFKDTPPPLFKFIKLTTCSTFSYYWFFKMPTTKCPAGIHEISTSQPECPLCMAEKAKPKPRPQPKPTERTQTPPGQQTSISSPPMSPDKKWCVYPLPFKLHFSNFHNLGPHNVLRMEE